MAPTWPAPPAEPGPAPAHEFKLRLGESAPAYFDPAWRIGFERVTADSRCPKGVQCIWAGDASVRVWMQRGAERRQTFELNERSGASQVLQGQPHQLRLVRLEPYPVAGKAIAAADYVATLALSRAAADN